MSYMQSCDQSYDFKIMALDSSKRSPGKAFTDSIGHIGNK